MRVGCRPIHRKLAKCNNDLILGNVKDCKVRRKKYFLKFYQYKFRNLMKILKIVTKHYTQYMLLIPEKNLFQQRINNCILIIYIT